MRRYRYGLIFFVLALPSYVGSQEKYEAGPLKGFAVAESSGTAIQITKAFKVQTAKGIVETQEGNVALGGAFFQMRNDSGAVFTATTDEQGTFRIADARAGTYTVMDSKGFSRCCRHPYRIAQVLSQRDYSHTSSRWNMRGA